MFSEAALGSLISIYKNKVAQLTDKFNTTLVKVLLNLWTKFKEYHKRKHGILLLVYYRTGKEVLMITPSESLIGCTGATEQLLYL